MGASYALKYGTYKNVLCYYCMHPHRAVTDSDSGAAALLIGYRWLLNEEVLFKNDAFNKFGPLFLGMPATLFLLHIL